MYDGGAKSIDIAARHSASVCRVYRIVKRYVEQGITTRIKQSGRQKMLDGRDVRHLVRHCVNHHCESKAQICASLLFSVSTCTMSWYLHQARIRSRIAPKKAFLTKLHRRRQLEFDRKYHHWTRAQWERIIWIDKSTFKLGNYSKVIWVWRQHSSKKYLASYVTPTFKSGRTSCMI
jgi:transposase